MTGGKILEAIFTVLSLVFLFAFIMRAAQDPGAKYAPKNPPPPVPVNDDLIGHPISPLCKEAYPVMCPTYHGDGPRAR